MVAQTRTASSAHPASVKLKFNEKLAGKGLSTDTLLKKLKVLHEELAALDQELVDVQSLNAVKKELINNSITMHKDRGVRAYAACCLADILRLYAPDAPYTQTELRDIFQFFFRQLSSGLKGIESPYYDEFFHLLESLSTVKSVVLVCDLPNAEELMVDVFRDFFGMVRRELARKIEMFMADILVALIDECQSLPSEVLETIMGQFMDKNAPAYRLVVHVCNSTADKLQRHVCQYFTDIIVSHSDDEQFEEIKTAHELIKRLNHSCPGLLQSVVPQLEEELRVEELQLRLIATQVLGDMFADKNGYDLVKKFHSTWNFWLMRKNDKIAAVRLKFVESTKNLLANVPEVREELENALSLKLLDPDEKVRAAVCKIYSQLDYETALHHVSESQLRSIAARGVDKKLAVRTEALNSIGKLYSLAYPEIEANDPAAIKQFSWIPNDILLLLTHNTDARSVADQVLAEYIFPLPHPSSSSKNSSLDVDEEAWTDRLLCVMSYLDERAIKSLLSWSGIKSRFSHFQRLIDACEKNNGGVIDDDEEEVTRHLESVIRQVAAFFPESPRIADDLRSFAKLNESRLYKLFKTCIDPQTDLKALVKSTNEFHRKLEQTSPSILPSLSLVLRRASLRTVNQSSISTLIKRIQRAADTSPDTNGDSQTQSQTQTRNASQAQITADNARIIMSFISKLNPGLYKAHVGELSKAIADERNELLVEVCLQALAAVVRWDGALAPSDKRTVERATKYLFGANYRHSKFAARLFAFSKDRDRQCARIVDEIAEKLPDAEPEEQAAFIAALAQFAQFAPEAFEQRSDTIIPFLIQHILMIPILADEDEMEVDDEWIPETEVSTALRARILALKVCRRRTLANARKRTALEISTPVLRMFGTILDHGGSLAANMNDSPTAKSRMRLQAAVSLLHLSTVDAYDKHIMTRFLPLALTIQDTSPDVRIIFQTKLISLLSSKKLSPKFNVIPFLTAHDPETEVKETAMAYVATAIRNQGPAAKVDNFEVIFVRLLHMIAHHPDFSTEVDDFKEITKYVEYYLDALASAETISLLYHLAMLVKTKRDADPRDESEKLYIMSELAQELIKHRAQLHSWILQGYPGEIKLPLDVLREFPDPKTSKQVMKTVYMPKKVQDWLKERHTKTSAPKEKKERKTATKRKAPAKSGRKGANTGKRRKSGRANYDDDDEQDEPSSSEESDADMNASSPGKAPPENASENDQEEEEKGSDKPEDMGRGARTRAKARSKKQTPSKRTAPRGKKVQRSERSDSIE